MNHSRSVPICVLIILVVFGVFYRSIHQIRHHGLYRFRRDGIFKNHVETNEYGLDYYVKSGFDKKYPAGTSARADIEKRVIKDYVKFGQYDCKRELEGQWRSDDLNYPTPNCDKLRRMGIKPIA